MPAFPTREINAVDVEAARAAPGVIAVLTAADVPVNEYGLIMPDQPVLCGTGSTEQARTVRWEADHIAVVVAETQAQAEAAAKLVKLDDTPLPVLTDPFAAMQPDAPILHPRPFRYPYGERDLNSNVLLEYKLVDGDIRAGFAEADVVVESVYRTHAQEHAYLQPEAGVAWVRPDGQIEVICGGQWMHEEREQIAHALGLPDDQIVVQFPAIGGAFGGREDISVQIVLALAAWKTGRPVKIVWTPRGEHRRPPQAPSLYHPRPLGRHAGGQDRRRPDGHDQRLRRLCLYQHEGAGQCPARRAGALQDPQCRRDGAHGLHQQHALGRVSRALAVRRATLPPKCRSTSWPSCSTWTRSSCACATSGATATICPPARPSPPA